MCLQEDVADLLNLDNCSKSDGMSLTDLRVTPKAVEREKNRKLNPAIAQGPDMVSPQVLTEISRELSTPLCLLFNKSLESGKTPEDWKTAEVTAIFRKGSKSHPSSCMLVNHGPS